MAIEIPIAVPYKWGIQNLWDVLGLVGCEAAEHSNISTLLF